MSELDLEVVRALKVIGYSFLANNLFIYLFIHLFESVPPTRAGGCRAAAPMVKER